MPSSVNNSNTLPLYQHHAQLRAILQRQDVNALRAAYHHTLIPKASLTNLFKTQSCESWSTDIQQFLSAQCIDQGLFSLALQYLPTPCKNHLFERYQGAFMPADVICELMAAYLPPTHIDEAAERFEALLMASCLHHHLIVEAVQKLGFYKTIMALQKKCNEPPSTCPAPILSALLALIGTQDSDTRNQHYMAPLQQILACTNLAAAKALHQGLTVTSTTPLQSLTSCVVFLAKHGLQQADTDLQGQGVRLWLSTVSLDKNRALAMITTTDIFKCIYSIVHEAKERADLFQSLQLEHFCHSTEDLAYALSLKEFSHSQRENGLRHFSLIPNYCGNAQVWAALKPSEKAQYPLFYPVELFLEKDLQAMYGLCKSTLSQPEQIKNECIKLLTQSFSSLNQPEQRAVLNYLKAIKGNQASRFEVINVLRQERRSINALLSSSAYGNTPTWCNALKDLTHELDSHPDNSIANNFARAFTS